MKPARGFAIALLLAAWVGAGRAAAESITLAVWASPPGESLALDHGIQAFTRATGIEVKKEVITDQYMDVLRSRFAARKTPDVIYLDSSEAPFLIKSEVLLPLDAYLSHPEDFYPQFLRAFSGEDGRLYGLPKDYSTLALYLNTDLLAKAGFKPADVPLDQAGLMAFAARLQPRLPPHVGAMIFEKDLARHLSSLEACGQPLIAANGGAHLQGNGCSLAYLQAFVDGRRAGYLFSPKADLGADSPTAAFGAGKAVMMMEGNWVLGNLHKDYADIAFVTREMPRVNGRAQTMAFVVGDAVPKYGRNTAGGIRFAQYMSSIGMAAWSRESGTLPTRRSVQAALRVAANAELAAHIAGAAYATVWSRGTSLPVAASNFSNQFLAALNGSKPLAQALQKAEAAANREIERQR